jgi:hypothetical protein
MAGSKRRVDPIKQREKRAKIGAIAGCVLLLAVGAYEVPSALKVMNKKPPPGTTYDPGPSGGGSALPSVAVQNTTGGLASNGDLADTDVQPASAAGQLVSFALFQTKNPFSPQVTAGATPTDTSGATTTTPGATSGTGTTPTLVTITPTSTTTTPITVLPPVSGATTTAAPPPSVAISVNGVVSHVGDDGTFPTSSPVFRLLSYKKGSAEVGIVGGSYADGGGALTLKEGVSVTLQNTTDGKRYTLKLLSTP